MKALLCFLFFAQASAAEKSCSEAFTSIYSNLEWGVAEDGDPSSGWGSFPVNASAYMEFLTNFIRSNDIHDVVDLGCGTWEFSRYIDWSGVNYVGVDVVEQVVQLNQKKFGAANIHFVQGDILAMSLPAGDLMICKDVLQHLQHADIQTFLKKIKQYKHCLLTNDLAISFTDSVDRTKSNRENEYRGRNRPLDLTKPPFNIKGSKVLSYPIGDHIKQVLYIRNDSL
ncbi:MAG: class I SAM-dependent methyltransferase [Chlamydiales bacterium]|nr:class I SAM-dependent methyltransferase [Chlamydiales bacterium]